MDGWAMSDIVERLRDACNGHPYAKIPWPHRVLLEAADEIERQRRIETAARAMIEAEVALVPIQDATGLDDEANNLWNALCDALQTSDDAPDETVVPFGGITTVDEPAEYALEKAKAWGCDAVVVVGAKGGGAVMGGSTSDAALVAWLLSSAQFWWASQTTMNADD